MSTALNELNLPAGYGFKLAARPTWDQSVPESLMDRLMVWEPPKRGFTYLVSVDVAEGLGQDRSVADVLRIGTITHPDEQVAQFITDSIDAINLAAYLDAIGRFYRDDDGYEALMAIEYNAHGYATQSEMQGHYGYTNFFVWEHFDVRDASRRFSNRIGWLTNARTRPMIVSRLIKALNSYVEPDPTNPARVVRAAQPDVIINSPFTVAELQDFQIPPGGALFQARASSGAHDDCVMSLAIALQVAQTRHFSEQEPLSEQRRRIAEEKEAKDALAARTGARRDYWNTAATLAEMESGEVLSENPSDWAEFLPERFWDGS